jgi:hypothetical protein
MTVAWDDRLDSIFSPYERRADDQLSPPAIGHPGGRGPGHTPNPPRQDPGARASRLSRATCTSSSSAHSASSSCCCRCSCQRQREGRADRRPSATDAIDAAIDRAIGASERAEAALRMTARPCYPTAFRLSSPAGCNVANRPEPSGAIQEPGTLLSGRSRGRSDWIGCGDLGVKRTIATREELIYRSTQSYRLWSRATRGAHPRRRSRGGAGQDLRYSQNHANHKRPAAV